MQVFWIQFGSMSVKGNKSEACCEWERYLWCGSTLAALWDSYEMNISLQIWCLLMAWYLCIWTDRCPDSTRPETVRPCLLLCKKDCIVTPFSEWTRCPTTCQPGKPLKREQNFGQTVTSIAMGIGMMQGARSWGEHPGIWCLPSPQSYYSGLAAPWSAGFLLSCVFWQQKLFNKPWASQAETGGCQCG